MRGGGGLNSQAKFNKRWRWVVGGCNKREMGWRVVEGIMRKNRNNEKNHF